MRLESEQSLRALETIDTDLACGDVIATAINTCLGRIDLLRAKSEEESIRSNERKRKDFVEKVIAKLEKVLFEAYRLDISAIFPAMREVTQAQQDSEFEIQSRPFRDNNLSTRAPDRPATERIVNPTSTLVEPIAGVLAATDTISLMNDDTGGVEHVDRARYITLIRDRLAAIY